MYFITLLYCLLLPVGDNYHIVFEQIGELASSVTYIHAHVKIPLAEIEDQLDVYVLQLHKFDKQFRHPEWFILSPESQKNMAHKETLNLHGQLVNRHLQAGRKLITTHMLIADDLIREIQHLRNSMPQPENERLFVKREIPNSTSSTVRPKLEVKMTFSSIPNPAKQVGRATRYIGPAGLVLGALGTFMGLFNVLQINALRQEMTYKHNLLVEVVRRMNFDIGEMNATLNVLADFMANGHVYDITVFASDLILIENEIKSKIHWATHGIQIAQNHRMAVDLLKASEVAALFLKLRKQCESAGQVLLVTQPSHLYQLETSYFYDGKTVHLLVHVPMVPKDSRLRLLKFHPFPIPLAENFTMIPDIDENILAVAPGFTRFSAQLSASDLLGCHSVNNVYLCDRHGVLNKELNNTCVGALYLQDFKIAKEICNFKIAPSKEIVKQLLDNWFLVFSPNSQTCFVECSNGTQKEIYMRDGINKIHLSPNCQADLKEHRLHADGSIHLSDDIQHFEWNWDITKNLNLDQVTLNDYIFELNEAGINSPTLTDLSHLKMKKTSPFKIFWNLLGFIFSCISIGAITFTIFVLVTRKIVIDWQKILNLFRKKPLIIEPLNENQTSLLDHRPCANHNVTHQISAPAPLYNLT